VFKLKLLAVVVPMLFVSSALAAVPDVPDAAKLQKEDIERQKYLNERKELGEKKPDNVIHREAEPQADPALAKPAASFILQEIRFSDSEQLSKAELAASVASYIGKPTTFAVLQKIRELVNGLYLNKNILTSSAVLRPQKIEAGVVYIDLIEGRVGKIDVKGNQYTRSSYVEGVAAFSRGKVLDQAKLERRLMDFNSAGVAQLRVDLLAGSQVGETDVVLNVIEEPRYQGAVFVNNEASDSVGKIQGGLTLSVNAPFGVNDKLSFYASDSKGSKFANIAYSIPLGYVGTLLNASYGIGKSDVTGGPYQNLDIAGDSKTMQFNVSQNLFSINVWDFMATGGWSRTNNDNTILGVELSNFTTDIKTIKLGTTARYNNRSLNANLSFNMGNSSGKPLPDRSVNTTQITASWLESLGLDHYVYARLFAQQASEAVLPSAMAMSLGGVGTIRGYPLGVVSGDQGFYVNLEWHHPVTAGFSGFVFYDQGAVSTKGFPKLNANSAGFGVDWTWKTSIQANLTLARPLREVVADQGNLRVTARLAYLF
jgi:hemolysin activation/secretion protein